MTTLLTTLPEHLDLPAEVESIHAWLCELEEAAERHPGGLARWYRSALMHCYFRVTRWRIAFPGQLSLCLVNIDVAEPIQRHGLFKLLIQKLSQDNALKAEILYVENTLNSHLASWLAFDGFTVVPGTELLPCFARNRMKSYKSLS